MKNMNKRRDALIRVLYTSSDLNARNTSILELAGFDDTKVLNALHVCGADQKEDKEIQAACGEAIAEIMVRNQQRDMKYIDGLSATALAAFKEYVKGREPDWLKEI